MSNHDVLASKLKEIVGGANVIEDPEKLKAFAVDGRSPEVLVAPGTIEETAKVVSHAHAEKLTVIPTGGGTKMALGGIPKKVEILLSTKRMNGYSDYDIANLTLGVQAGLTLAEVQGRLAGEGRGYCIPLDPPYTREATIGGVVATNDSGPKRFLYGAARDIILGVRAVSPNGDIVVSGGKAVKNVAGYDMTKFMIGSMGAVGIICEVIFRIYPKPDAEATLLLPFNGLAEATAYLNMLLQSKFFPASLELMNARTAAGIAQAAGIKGSYLAAIGLEGIEEAVARQVSELSELGRKGGSLDVVTLKDQPQRDFWIAYRDLVGTLAKSSPNLVALKSNFVLSKVPEMVAAYETALREAGLDASLTCHAGNGLLYAAIPLGEDLGAKTAAVAALVERLTGESVNHGGNLVVQRAPRAIKEKVSVWGKTRSDAVVVRRLKEKLDPSGILNPGRYVAGV
jgi:glycolate oxidase FAD binding subunit